MAGICLYQYGWPIHTIGVRHRQCLTALYHTVSLVVNPLYSPHWLLEPQAPKVHISGFYRDGILNFGKLQGVNSPPFLQYQQNSMPHYRG